MKKNISTKKSKQNNLLLITVPLLSLSLYAFHIMSGFEDSGGTSYIAFNSFYPVLLFIEYTAATLLLLPFIIKAKNDSKISDFLIPLILISSLGMTRLDSDTYIENTKADYSPFIMFIIFFVTLIIMALTKTTLTGLLGTLAGTAAFPSFGIAFSPFIVAATLLFSDKNQKTKKLSVILNGILSLICTVYGIIRLKKPDLSFTRELIPVILIIAVLSFVFIIKKDYELLPLALSGIFPLTAEIIFGLLPTPALTLSAVVCSFTAVFGTSVFLSGNKKTEGYAQKIVHNPALYIVIAFFILHTTYVIFMLPGTFRHIYR